MAPPTLKTLVGLIKPINVIKVGGGAMRVFTHTLKNSIPDITLLRTTMALTDYNFEKKEVP